MVQCTVIEGKVENSQYPNTCWQHQWHYILPFIHFNEKYSKFLKFVCGNTKARVSSKESTEFLLFLTAKKRKTSKDSLLTSLENLVENNVFDNRDFFIFCLKFFLWQESGQD